MMLSVWLGHVWMNNTKIADRQLNYHGIGKSFAGAIQACT